jgi:hyperosmotically inducible periplasmic protein
MKSIIRKFGFASALTAMFVPGFLLASNRNKQPHDLADQVRHKLVMLPYFGVFDNLAYRVDGNTVTLFGEVVRPILKSDAENAVKHIEGVAQVVNDIKVLPVSMFDDQIRRAEYRAIFSYAGLYRYGMGTVPSIHIIVDNGHVTLIGVVSNEADKNLAGIRANGVPGAFSVTNDLQVERRS